MSDVHVHWLTPEESAEMDRHLGLILMGDRKTVELTGEPARQLIERSEGMLNGDRILILWGQDGLTVCGNADLSPKDSPNG